VQSRAATVDQYLAELPEARRSTMTQLRALIREVAPTARECMRYGVPSYEMGELLCAVAAQKQHYSLYVMDAKLLDRFRAQLGKLSVGKGCIRFRKLEDAPLPLVRKILSEAAARRMKGVTKAPCDERDG
jgi:uncharacterized protein YdhG (YjbR/CyaY superfamily)